METNLRSGFHVRTGLSDLHFHLVKWYLNNGLAGLLSVRSTHWLPRQKLRAMIVHLHRLTSYNRPYRLYHWLGLRPGNILIIIPTIIIFVFNIHLCQSIKNFVCYRDGVQKTSKRHTVKQLYTTLHVICISQKSLK